MALFGRWDLRDPAKEKYGKEAISWPDQSLLHPTLTMAWNGRKNSTLGSLPFLTLSNYPAAAGCYLVKQASTKGDDDGSNINQLYDRLPGVVKDTYPIDPTFGIVTKVSTQVVIATKNPKWLGQRFSGELTLTAIPSNNEVVAVGDVTYTFKTVLTGAANEVKIASTIAECLFNLSSAINIDYGIGVNFGTGTVLNPKAVSWYSLNTMIVADTNAVSAAIATTTTCAAGSWTAATTTLYVFIEQKDIDPNRDYRIVSRILVVPPDITYWLGKEISLPDTLQSAAMVWDESTDAGGATQDENSRGGASAQASAGHFVDGGLALQILNGFRGVAKAQYTRHFTLTAPVEGDIASPTIIKPALGTALIRTKGMTQAGKVGDYGASVSGSSKVAVKTQHIGPVLTGTLGVITNSTTGAGTWAGTAFNFILTQPSTPTNGQTVTIGGKVYTWQTSLTNTDGHVLIGANATTALLNLLLALNLGAGSGANYAAATTVNTNAIGLGSDVSTLTVIAKSLTNPDFVPTNVTFNASAPSGGTYDAVAVAAHAEGHAQLTMPASVPASINSGDTIVFMVDVEEWRLHLFMIISVTVKVP